MALAQMLGIGLFQPQLSSRGGSCKKELYLIPVCHHLFKSFTALAIRSFSVLLVFDNEQFELKIPFFGKRFEFNVN